MLEKILHIIAPHTCCVCGEVGIILCTSCKHDIQEMGYMQCVVCLRPTTPSQLCRACRSRSLFADAWVVGVRESALRELIDRYKFERAKIVSDVAAELLDAALPQLPGLVVTYVPTIAAHRRQRGYDHMQLIAQALAARRGWRCETLLLRTRSVPQRGATLAQRKTQQYGAFTASHHEIDRPILLLDDVYTTGGTVAACAEVLHSTTDQPIYLAIVARQPKH